jgi:phage shock protein PspC (stress-responsive transcriptional regulator)
MNEITHIHLGRTAFTVAVDAHHALRAYLHDIDSQTGKNKEVMEEVELRMAELLGERGILGDKVILMQDVEYLKEQLGEPSDFSDSETDDDAGKAPAKRTADHDSSAKQLFRDTEHGMVAGVAAGLGAYFKIDPVIFRIIFVVLTFASGAGIVAYLVLWLLVPPVKSESDRLKLNGKPVTIENIKETLARADVEGVARKVAKHSETAVIRVLTVLGWVITVFVGIMLLLFGLAVLTGTAAAATYALAHGWQMGGAVMFPVSGEDYAAIAANSAFAIAIGTLFVLFGRAVVRRKWKVPGWVLVALIAVGIAGAAVGVTATTDVIQPVRNRYNSVRHTETRALPVFTAGTLDLGDVNYRVVPSSQYKLEINTIGSIDTRIIKTAVKDGKLNGNAAVLKRGNCWAICPYGPTNTEVVLYAPDTAKITVNGAYTPVTPVTPATLAIPETPVTPETPKLQGN